MTLTYFLPPLGRIGIIARWARERALRCWFPLNDNSRSPSHGESASVSAHVPTRQLAGLTDCEPDTVTAGHFCGEGRT